jgi:hypothetical protein
MPNGAVLRVCGSKKSQENVRVDENEHQSWSV